MNLRPRPARLSQFPLRPRVVAVRLAFAAVLISTLAIMIAAKPLTAQEGAFGAADVVLVIDHSPSMATSDPDEQRVAAARELIDAIPEDVVAVAESGLRTGSDLAALRETGYDAFLIGESLMRRPSPGGELAALLEEAGAPVRGRRRAAAPVEEAGAR